MKNLFFLIFTASASIHDKITRKIEDYLETEIEKNVQNYIESKRSDMFLDELSRFCTDLKNFAALRPQIEAEIHTANDVANRDINACTEHGAEAMINKIIIDNGYFENFDFYEQKVVEFKNILDSDPQLNLEKSQEISQNFRGSQEAYNNVKTVVDSQPYFCKIPKLVQFSFNAS